MWLVLLALGCPASREIPPPDVQPVPVPAAEPSPVAIAEPAPADPAPATAPAEPAPVSVASPPDLGDFYTVTSDPVLSGTDLRIGVSHGGGCATHDFTLLETPREGGRLDLWLHHDANGDRCKAIVRTDLVLSVAGFLEAGDCTDAIAVHTFAGSDSPTETVLRLDPPHGCD